MLLHSSAKKNLTLTSFLRLRNSDLSSTCSSPAIMVNSTEITPVCQRISCARAPGPCTFGWSHQCWTLEQDQCLTLLLWLCKCIPRFRDCFAAHVHCFLLGSDCCLLGTCCLSVPFLQSCFCSVSPSLSYCRGESFPGLWETPEVVHPYEWQLISSAWLNYSK